MHIRNICLVTIFICFGFSDVHLQAHAGKAFDVSFLRFEGRRQNQTVTDLNGDGLKDFVVTSINFDVNPPVRWISVFFQMAKGTFSEVPDQAWKLHSNACAIVFGNFSRQHMKDICYVGKDGVYMYPFDPIHKRFIVKPQKLIHTGTYLKTVSLYTIPILHPTEDLDANGLDDLIIPVEGGYKLYRQTAIGHFGRIGQIRVEDMSYGEIPETGALEFNIIRQIPRVGIADINGDGRKDLVNVNGVLMTYFFQKEDGSFPSEPSFRFILRSLANTSSKTKVDVSKLKFLDINGDGKSDLMVTKTGGSLGVFESLKTYVMIFLGNGSGRFHRLDTKITLSGISIDPNFADINNDGLQDLYMSSVRADLLDVGKSYLLHAVDVKFYIYVFDKETNNYPKDGASYSYSSTVELKKVRDEGVDSLPRIYIQGDHSGDGRPDLVRMNANGVLEIRKGKSVRVLSAQTSTFSTGPFYLVKLERLPKEIRVMSINSDKIMDIMLEYNSAVGLCLSR